MFENISKKIDNNREFSEAINRWDVEAVKALFAEDKQEFPNLNQELVTAPAIMLSAIKQNWEMFNALYELGAELHVKTINGGWHLIHECVKNAPLHITKGIMAECNLDVQTEDGRTPLMVAIKERNETVALALLDSQGLSLSLADNKGNNAGHYAAQYGLNELFLRLIKEGLPLDRKNKEGKYAADLIQDEFFKASVPTYEVQIAKEVAKEVAKEIQKDDRKDEEPKQVSGLSKIGKKKF